MLMFLCVLLLKDIRMAAAVQLFHAGNPWFRTVLFTGRTISPLSEVTGFFHTTFIVYLNSLTVYIAFTLKY